MRHRQALAHLPCSLAQGEREAILLAEEEGATLLVDERKAREAAEQRGIAVVGSLRVLREAKQRGLIIVVRPIVEELLAIGYWMHPKRVIRPFFRKWGKCHRRQNRLKSNPSSNDSTLDPTGPAQAGLRGVSDLLSH